MAVNEVPVPGRQVPSIHHRRIGDIVVTAISDGFLDGSLAALQNIEEDEAARLLREAFRPSAGRRTSVNTFLVRSGGRACLVHTGCGRTLQSSAGRVFDNLEAAGVSAAAIDTILLTHMHPDHSNGLSDPSGAALFPHAEICLHEAELSYWTADQNAGTDGYFDMARRQLAPYRDRLRTFTSEVEVFPGVTSVPLPGHTPGHTGYLSASGGQTLLIWGDIVHAPEIQVPRPEVTMVFDVDPVLAEATRRRTFDRWRATDWRSQACTCIFQAGRTSPAATGVTGLYLTRGHMTSDGKSLHATRGIRENKVCFTALLSRKRTCRFRP